ncbi:MAG: S-layer homology domain-containing protein [Ruminococcaceae bacterium]|nr:S-layer homology domain-containing protein [Oscillospiraceae bacterium]
MRPSSSPRINLRLRDMSSRAGLPKRTTRPLSNRMSGSLCRPASVAYTTATNTTPVEIAADTNGLYSFTMPKGNVTVTATFVPENDNDPSVGKGIISGYSTGYQGCTGYNCVLLKFSDLDPAAWYHDGIHFCLENGIMQGFGNDKFQPLGLTTRAQVVTTLWNIAGHPISASPITFKDVNPDDWFYDAIMWAAGNGIVNGYGDGTFGPNDMVTREQIAKIFYGYAQFYGFDVSATSDLAGYEGVDEISAWALPYVKWAVGAGVCCGAEGNHKVLAPTQNAGRAELATMILNFCMNVARK